jgi:MoaA/NifB/PqqE/SkfB family radical SAM enzyme
VPCSLWLELTPYCNLDCGFCYNPWRGKPTDQYPRAHDLDWRQLAGRLCSRHRFDYVALSGGEPLLFAEICDLVSDLAALDQSIIVTTNGRVATAARLSALAEAGLGGIQVPLLAMNRGVHDALSGRPSWRWAVRAVLLAQKLGLSVSVTFVGTAENILELPRVAAFAEAVGVRDLVVNEVHLQGQGLGRDALRPSPSQCIDALTRARTVAPSVAVHPRPSSPELRTLLGTRVAADGPWHRVAVDPQGRLKLCNQSQATFGTVGSITDDRVDYLISAIESGEVAQFQNQVDSCACFEGRKQTLLTHQLVDQ